MRPAIGCVSVAAVAELLLLFSQRKVTSLQATAASRVKVAP
jgi:hypothetical protein